MHRPDYPAGTRVALYLRRSHDKHQEESLETQRRSAVEFCAARGWVIVEEFVDGEDRRASRAEFQKRPGLIRLVNHAKAKAFELVVVRDETRLGGDQQRTGLLMQDLIDAGVGIVYYIDGEFVEMENAVDKFLVAARNFASELEREKISSRVHERLLQKAKAGKPAGGLSYGYAIEDDCYVVKAGEAAVVRRIFAEYQSGRGFRAIVYKLNKEGVTPPRGRSWNPTSARGILTNPRYIGEARYNQVRHVYRGGTKVKERRPEAEHVTYVCPAIVSRKSWEAVQARLAKNPRFGERSADPKGPEPKYLLTGISRCAACGGPITVKRRKAAGKSSTPSRGYQCAQHKNNGPAVCASGRTELCEYVDVRVLAAVCELITHDIITEVIEEVRVIQAEQRATAPAERERLRATIDGLRREIDRLTTALATVDSPPPSLLQAIAERDARLRQTELALEAASTAAEVVDEIELHARRKLQNLKTQLQHPETARAALVALTGGEKLQFEAAPQGGFRVIGSLDLVGLIVPDCVSSHPSSDTVRAAGRLAFVA